MRGEKFDGNVVLQVLAVKRLLAAPDYNGQEEVERERFRIALSDGRYFTKYGMLSVGITKLPGERQSFGSFFHNPCQEIRCA